MSYTARKMLDVALAYWQGEGNGGVIKILTRTWKTLEYGDRKEIQNVSFFKAYTQLPLALLNYALASTGGRVCGGIYLDCCPCTV